MSASEAVPRAPALAIRSHVASPLRQAVAMVRVELGRSFAMIGAAWRLRRAARMLAPPDLHVHLGCSDDIRTGWLNVDFSTSAEARSRAARSGGRTAFVRMDLRRGLPLPPASCATIYSSHFLEHLEYRHAVRLLRDCHRALVPGGRFRAALPDFRKVAEAYVARDSSFFDLINITDAFPHNEPGMHALIDYVNYAAYQSGEHRVVYDEDKLEAMLRATGFADVRASDFDPGIDPASTVRRRYSLYVEAVK